MESSDPPPPVDALLVAPLIPNETPPLIGFPSVRPLILRVSPPPGSSDPEEYYYNPLPDVVQGSFAAAHAFLLSTAMRSQGSTAPTLTHFWSPSLVLLFVRLLSCRCWCSCKGVNSSSIRLLPDSRLGLMVLQSGGAPQLLLPDRSSIVTWSSPQDQSLPCCLQRSFRPLSLRLSNLGGAAIMFPLRCITGVCPLAPIQLALTLLCLLTGRYVMWGMALSPIIRSHRMSVLPWHCVLTKIMGGSSVQLPLLPKISTATIPTMAILCIMGGTRQLKRVPQCMGGVLLLFGMFLQTLNVT
jgi:hypothetical protein